MILEQHPQRKESGRYWEEHTRRDKMWTLWTNNWPNSRNTWHSLPGTGEVMATKVFVANWWDVSAGNSMCCQARRPEFNPWNPSSGRIPSATSVPSHVGRRAGVCTIHIHTYHIHTTHTHTYHTHHIHTTHTPHTHRHITHTHTHTKPCLHKTQTHVKVILRTLLKIKNNIGFDNMYIPR